MTTTQNVYDVHGLDYGSDGEYDPRDTITLPSPCCGAALVDEDEATLICDACGQSTNITRGIVAD